MGAQPKRKTKETQWSRRACLSWQMKRTWKKRDLINSSWQRSRFMDNVFYLGSQCGLQHQFELWKPATKYEDCWWESFIFMQVSIWLVTIPLRYPGAFAPKCVPSPRAFTQQTMPGGRANKWRCPWGWVFASTGFQTWKLLKQSSGLKN